MGCGERRVKRLDAQCRRVCVEARRVHERHRAQASDIAIMELSSIVQREAHRRVWRLYRRQWTAAQEERAGEAGLYDDPVARVEVQNDQLGATPRAHEGASDRTRYELGRRTLAEHVWPGDGDFGDAATGDLAIQVARDRLSLWELRHRGAASDARSRAIQCPGDTACPRTGR